MNNIDINFKKVYGKVMDKQIEDLATIRYCLETIEQKLSEPDLENRWIWEVRQKIAHYVYSYLQQKQSNDIELPAMSEEQKQDIIENHPLMQPFNQASIGITSEQRARIQKEICDNINKMYLVRKIDERVQ